MSESENYDVYLARFKLVLQDPDMPSPRFHTTIFVQTAEETGTKHHVTGDITSRGGMTYTPQPSECPQLSPDFHSSEKLGVTPVSKHPDVWLRVLRSIPTPPQQKAFNTETLKTEPFKTKDPLTFYEPGDPRRPLVRCTEWTLERALPALRENGLIIPE